jgi:hypothetical protein
VGFLGPNLLLCMHMHGAMCELHCVAHVVARMHSFIGRLMPTFSLGGGEPSLLRIFTLIAQYHWTLDLGPSSNVALSYKRVKLVRTFGVYST